MTTEESFTIDFATGVTYDLDAIRKRQSAFMPDNGHSWVVSTVYALDDPEQAIDAMELGPDNFVGITAVHCLLCAEPYVTTNRYGKCPQQLPALAERRAS